MTSLHNQMLVVTTVIGVTFTAINLYITSQQFNAAQRASALDQRPWVTVKSVKLAGLIAEGMKPILTVIWVNSGKTPALRVKATGLVRVGKSGAAPTTPLPTLTSGYLIGPGDLSENSLPIYAPLSKDEIEAIHAGTYSIYINLNSVYTDVFGGVHHSQFSAYITKDGMETGVIVSANSGNNLD